MGQLYRDRELQPGHSAVAQSADKGRLRGRVQRPRRALASPEAAHSHERGEIRVKDGSIQLGAELGRLSPNSNGAPTRSSFSTSRCVAPQRARTGAGGSIFPWSLSAELGQVFAEPVPSTIEEKRGRVNATGWFCSFSSAVKHQRGGIRKLTKKLRMLSFGFVFSS